nr:MAG TPA: hypothetical protein [Caudoviricetes sp.]
MRGEVSPYTPKNRRTTARLSAAFSHPLNRIYCCFVCPPVVFPLPPLCSSPSCCVR